MSNPITVAGRDTHPANNTIDAAGHRRRILVAVCVALMAVIAAVTGLNVAQPPLAIDLDASQAEALWMINIYAITLAALLLPLGAVGDRWGRKPVLLAGLIIFGISNIASGFAPSVEAMLGARFLSGIGAAMIMPVTLSVITSVFPDDERSRAVGVWTGVAGGGGILGMFLSAVLVDYLNWRWLFALPVVLVVIAFGMTLREVPDSQEHPDYRFDLGGALISIAAIIGLIWFLHEGPTGGWMTSATIAGLVIGIGATVAFVVWELRHPSPLLDIRFFGQHGLTGGSVALLTWFGVQTGVFIVLYPFFQAVLGWSGLQATFGLMPMAMLMMGFSGVAPHAAKRFGARTTLAVGVLMGGAGLALIAGIVSVEGGFLSVLPGMIVMGIGMGLSMAPATEAITSSLPSNKQGVASALNDVTRELGTALGVALLGAVFSAGYGAAVLPKLAGLPEDLATQASRGIATALYLASQSARHADVLRDAAREAFVDGWQQAMWAGAVVMGLLFLFVVFRGLENATQFKEQQNAV